MYVGVDLGRIFGMCILGVYLGRLWYEYLGCISGASRMHLGASMGETSYAMMSEGSVSFAREYDVAVNCGGVT